MPNSNSHAGRQTPDHLGVTTSQTNVRALNVPATTNTMVNPNNNANTYSLAAMRALNQAKRCLKTVKDAVADDGDAGQGDEGG